MGEAELFPEFGSRVDTGPYRIGTSGFSFGDWVGPVYPQSLPKVKMLEYYEQTLGFDTVELNYTYYSMPVPKTMESMVRRTRDDFLFVVRSHKDMTHDIWSDDKRRVLKDTSAAFSTFKEGIRPLRESGRLGCLLVQLPVYFWPVPDNFRYLRRMPELLPEVPLVVEFRNKSWVRDSTFRMLEESGMGYCVVDEPKLPRLVPFDPRRTSDIAYFRFHGRNQNWFNASKEERYDYLYSRSELGEFVGPIREVTKGAGKGGAGQSRNQKSETRSQKTEVGGKGRGRTFIFFNNCHAGSAARNAVMMKQMLDLVQELSPVQQRLVEGT